MQHPEGFPSLRLSVNKILKWHIELRNLGPLRYLVLRHSKFINFACSSAEWVPRQLKLNMKNLAAHVGQEEMSERSNGSCRTECPRVVNRIQSNKIQENIATGSLDSVVIICKEI